MRIYFSGTHGAGKSSLIKAVARLPDFISYPDRLKLAKVDKPYFLRQKSKIAKIFQEYCDLLEFEKQHPDKIILGDRCIYDCFVYGNAYERLGWITKQENQELKDLGAILEECWPDNLVVLNPPYETLVDHIHQRWKTKQKKWNEDNFDYLRAVHEEFKKLPDYYQGNLLYIDEKVSIERERDMTTEWIKEKCLEKILVEA